MTDEIHPFPGDWHWYASFDGGEHCTVGPCADRDEAIALAIEDGSGEYEKDGVLRASFVIVRAKENNQDLARWFDLDRWLEDVAVVMDDNGCGADENGDQHPLDEITSDQQKDLDRRIQQTIRSWQKEHGLKLRSYWFLNTAHEEDIDIPIKEEATND